MRLKTFLVVLFVLAVVIPASADDKKKKRQPDRAMLEKMDAVPCGAKQKGVTGLGSIWASVGITKMSSDEKMCPRYLLRTDEMEYEIQPTDKKHPAILPVGQEVVFKIKKDHMAVKCPEGDKKTRAYEVIAMKPTETEQQNASAKAERP
ncbi:MAG TPA: hypothetical protein VN025_02660 [Candidatus Dormibacteraeota bacterium]|nr:hypothetical protein [Candidatus Dormibacteraeota bacterium]